VGKQKRNCLARNISNLEVRRQKRAKNNLSRISFATLFVVFLFHAEDTNVRRNVVPQTNSAETLSIISAQKFVTKTSNAANTNAMLFVIWATANLAG
jgi:hypothetical protein